jgi:hypothetical protein
VIFEKFDPSREIGKVHLENRFDCQGRIADRWEEFGTEEIIEIGRTKMDDIKKAVGDGVQSKDLAIRIEILDEDREVGERIGA